MVSVTVTVTVDVDVDSAELFFAQYSIIVIIVS